MKFKYLYFFLLLFNCSDDEISNSEDIQLSSENELKEFRIRPNDESLYGIINQSASTITINTYGIEQQYMQQVFVKTSPKSSVYPESGTIQNLQNPLDYVVTAENGNQRTYSVILNNTQLSNEKRIETFDLNINGVIYSGDIDHTNLTIDITVNDIPSNALPLITLSNGATINPSPVSTDFSSDVLYEVIAENLTSNIYTVKTKFTRFNNLILGNKYYSNLSLDISGYEIDLSLPNAEIWIENDLNSYNLNYSNYNEYIEGDFIKTTFSIDFPNTIVSAINYKLKYKVNGVTLVESNYFLDILSENIPEITGTNSTSYQFFDTLKIYGNNLIPGIRIFAHNISIYSYDQNNSNLVVNNNQTELTYLMNINQIMFPSYTADPVFATKIHLYYAGRYGDFVIVDFY